MLWTLLLVDSKLLVSFGGSSRDFGSGAPESEKQRCALRTTSSASRTTRPSVGMPATASMTDVSRTGFTMMGNDSFDQRKSGKEHQRKREISFSLFFTLSRKRLVLFRAILNANVCGWKWYFTSEMTVYRQRTLYFRFLGLAAFVAVAGSRQLLCMIHLITATIFLCV